MYELPRKGRNENKGRSGGTQESLDKKRGGEPRRVRSLRRRFFSGFGDSIVGGRLGADGGNGFFHILDRARGRQ